MNYVNKDFLYYEVKLSLGKGKMTDKLFKMLYLISYHTQKRLSKYYRKDQVQEGILELLIKWNGVDINRYSNLLPYYTEVAKRAMTRVYRQHKNLPPSYDPDDVFKIIYFPDLSLYL